MVTSYFPLVDELVMEYLLFRGFTNTFQSFQLERKTDNTRSFDVDKLTADIYGFILRYEMDALNELWSFLDARFFSHLDGSYTQTVRKLELSLQRFFLVNAIQTDQKSKVQEYFTRYASQVDDQGWKQWFSLPYLEHPEHDPYFRTFFNPQWIEAIFLSLRNFLSLVFRNLPLPKLLAFQISQLEDQAVQMELKVSQSECHSLRLHLVDMKETNQKMKIAGQQLHQYLHQLVRYVYKENYTGKETSENLSETATLLEQWKTIFFPNEDISTHQDQASQTGPGSHSCVSNPSCEIPPKNTIAKENSFASTTILEGHRGGILNCKFSCDGKYLASAATDATVRIWSMPAETPSKPICTRFSSTNILSMDWTTSDVQDQLLLYGTADRAIRLWNMTKQEEIMSMKTDTHLPQVTSLVCNPNSPMFVCALASSNGTYDDRMGNTNGALVCWDINTGQVRQNLPFESPLSRISAIAMNHHGTLLMAGSTDGFIRLYDIRQSNAVMGWQAHEGHVTAVEFSRDEKSMFSVSTDCNIFQWSLQTGKSWEAKQDVLLQYAGNASIDNKRRYLALNPAGNAFIVSSSGYTPEAYVYHVATANPIQAVNQHTARIVAVDWHPLQEKFVTGSDDTTIRLWERF